MPSWIDIAEKIFSMRYSSFAIAALVGGSAAMPTANVAPKLKQLQKLGKLASENSYMTTDPA